MACTRFSIREAISYGFRTVFNNLGFFIGLSLLLLAVSILCKVIIAVLVGPWLLKNPLFNKVCTTESTVTTCTSIFNASVLPMWISLQGVASLLNIFVSQIIILAWVRAGLAMYDYKTAHFGVIWPSVNLAAKSCVASILFTIFLVGGFILFIIPALIIGVMFFLYSWILVDTNAGPWQALKESARITRGCRMKLFLFCLVNALVVAAGILALGVGMLVTIPVGIMATTYVYRHLRMVPMEYGQ